MLWLQWMQPQTSAAAAEVSKTSALLALPLLLPLQDSPSYLHQQPAPLVGHRNGQTHSGCSPAARGNSLLLSMDLVFIVLTARMSDTCCTAAMSVSMITYMQVQSSGYKPVANIGQHGQLACNLNSELACTQK
jgi:hypothetical protein